MATVKVKFRASSVPGKEGTLYYHLIHQRCLRWISTDYHVFPDEWNDKKSAIIVSDRNNRQAHLQLIQSQIEGHGVLSDTSVEQPCLIHFHHLAGHL